MKKKLKGVNVWTLDELKFHTNTVSVQLKDGTWGPARPIGHDGFLTRLKAAWMVFTCKADALIWPEDN